MFTGKGSSFISKPSFYFSEAVVSPAPRQLPAGFLSKNLIVNGSQLRYNHASLTPSFLAAKWHSVLEKSSPQCELN